MFSDGGWGEKSPTWVGDLGSEIPNKVLEGFKVEFVALGIGSRRCAVLILLVRPDILSHPGVSISHGFGEREFPEPVGIGASPVGRFHERATECFAVGTEQAISYHGIFG